MYLVTGGAGFIGSNIVWALESQGVGKVIVCDRLRQDNKWRNLAKRELAGIVPPENLFDFLEANATNVEAVIHMAAISSTIETDVDLIIDTNFRLSVDLWHWCTQHRVRFIYASSAATYGDGSQGFGDNDSVESLSRLKPLNAYGWSKHLFDQRVAHMRTNSFSGPPQSVGLKFFNVYGPNEAHKGSQRSVVHQAWGQITDHGRVVLFRSHNPAYADGEQLRDFIYVDDCVAAMLWFLDHREVSGLFNLGTGKARTFLDLANAVFASMNREPDIQFIDTPEPIRVRYQYYTCARMERLREAGFDSPFTPLEDGVDRYVRGTLEN